MSVVLKRNDVKDVVTYTITNADGTPVNLTGATVRFVMGSKDKLYVDSVATIVNTTGGVVQYTFTEQDTLVAGIFMAEFQVTFDTGKKKSYPNDGYINVSIQPNVDPNQSTYVEQQVANQVSEVNLVKDRVTTLENRVNNMIVQSGTDVAEVVDARLDPLGTVHNSLRQAIVAQDNAVRDWVKLFGLGGQAKALGTGYNLNVLFETGFYMGSNLVNAPYETTNWWYIINIMHNEKWQVQIAIPFGNMTHSHDPYIRHKMEATPGSVTWTSWAQQDGVFEQGWNGNGHYVKHLNGVMECWHVDNNPANYWAWEVRNVAGDVCYVTYGTWVFPASFKAGTVPSVHCSGDIPIMAIENHQIWTNTNTGASYEHVSLKADGRSALMMHTSYYARGFWK